MTKLLLTKFYMDVVVEIINFLTSQCYYTKISSNVGEQIEIIMDTGNQKAIALKWGIEGQYLIITPTEYNERLKNCISSYDSHWKPVGKVYKEFNCKLLSPVSTPGYFKFDLGRLIKNYVP